MFKVENERLWIQVFRSKFFEEWHWKCKERENELSVALKRSKKENKENIETMQDEKGVLEKKIVDLHEYKMKNVNEWWTGKKNWRK